MIILGKITIIHVVKCLSGIINNLFLWLYYYAIISPTQALKNQEVWKEKEINTITICWGFLSSYLIKYVSGVLIPSGTQSLNSYHGRKIVFSIP